MIESKDLRIGNNLLWGSTIVQISSIHEDNTIRFWDANKINTVGCFKINAFNPIHLTDEILLKCGFEMNRLSFSIKFQLNNFIIFKIDDYFYAKPIGVKISLNSLHQLQNLYFALTGEELLLLFLLY